MNITSVTLRQVAESRTGAVELVFAPRRPFSFLPGQAVLLFVPRGGAKPFTISAGAGSGTVSIATSLSSGSPFKRALAQLRPGDRARMVGPLLGALPSPGAARPLVLVAQGIGITPFLSLARTVGTMHATLLQVGTPHYFDETAATMSSAAHHDHREQFAASVDATLAAEPDARWALSGRRDFVTGIAHRLHDAGVPAARIHKDAFWTMGAAPTVPTAPDLAPAAV